MRRSLKYGKITIVLFLTILVWVWADLAKTDEETISNAIIEVAESTREDLWVSFEDQKSAPIKKIVLTGASSRIDSFRIRLSTSASRLRFEYDATKLFATPQSHSLSLVSFLQEQRIFRDLGLKVESCEPETIAVKVVQLTKKPVDVKCFDENDNLVPATIIPRQVSMYVPDANESFVARVPLSDSDVQQAKEAALHRFPFIMLATDVIRRAETQVEIQITGARDLQPYNINPILGLAVSQQLLGELMAGEYKVELDNELELRAPVTIRATREAMNAYKAMTFHVILEIKDEVKGEETSRQMLIYNFPPTYVRRNEIMLDPPNSGVLAQFRLVPKQAVGGAPTAPPR